MSALRCTPTAGGTALVHVTVKDAGGETTSQTVTLTVHASVSVVGHASTAALDIGQSVIFNATASGGIGAPYTFVWVVTGSSCGVPVGTSITCTPPSPATVNATVTVNDSLHGVAIYHFAPVRALAPPSVTDVVSPASGAAPLTVNFQANALGGLAPYNALWVFGDGFTSAEANTSHTYPSPGVYDATIWVNDSLGRGTSASVTVRVGTLPDLVVTASPTHDEVGRTTVLATSVSGGEPPLAYSWSGLPTGCTAGNVPEVNCTPAAAGSYSIVATVTDAYGSVARQTLALSVAPPLGAAVRVLCRDGPVLPDLGDRELHGIRVGRGGSGTLSRGRSAMGRGPRGPPRLIRTRSRGPPRRRRRPRSL